jgi:hypothetical protein
VIHRKWKQGKAHHCREDSCNPAGEVDEHLLAVEVLRILIDQGEQTCQEGKNAMDRGVEQKGREILVVTLGHTGSHPGTVMIVHFYTGVTS